MRGGHWRRLPRSRRGVPRRRGARGARRRRGRPLGRAPPRRRSRPARAGAGQRVRGQGDAESRRHTRPRPGGAARVPPRGARPRGRALSADPHRPHRRRPGGAVRVRLGDRHEPQRRRRAAEPRAWGREARSPPSGRARLRRSCAAELHRISCRRSRRRRASSSSCRVPQAACCSPLPRVRAWRSSTSWGLTSCRSTGRSSCDLRRRRAISSCLRRHRPLARSAPWGRICPPSRSGLRRAGPRARRAFASFAEAERHDLGGLVDAVARLGS